MISPETVASPFSSIVRLFAINMPPKMELPPSETLRPGSDNIQQNRAISQAGPTALLRTLPKNRALAGRAHRAILNAPILARSSSG